MSLGNQKPLFDERSIIKNTHVLIQKNSQGLNVIATTPRLTIRTTNLSDSQFYQSELFAQPEVMKKWNDGQIKLYADEESEKRKIVNFADYFIKESTEGWQQGNPWRMMTVIETATKKLLGGICIWDNDLAYLYAQSSWGQRFASEAACALTGAVVPSLILAGIGTNLKVVEATARPDHPASQKVLSRAGLKTNGQVVQVEMEGKLLDRYKYEVSVKKLIEDYRQIKSQQSYTPFYQLTSFHKNQPTAAINIGGHSLRRTSERSKRYT